MILVCNTTLTGTIHNEYYCSFCEFLLIFCKLFLLWFYVHAFQISLYTNRQKKIKKIVERNKDPYLVEALKPFWV